MPGTRDGYLQGEPLTEHLPESSDYGTSLLEELGCEQALLPMPVPGERLGGSNGQRFEIRQALGGGGMGEVYRAWDEELQRVVALKFLLPRAARSQSPTGELLPMGELLKEEARAIARLDHENIVRLYDVSEWAAGPRSARIPFLVMECLEGESLSALLRQGPPGLERSLEIMEGVAAGLAHAHQRHLIHRDLKPGNVLLTRGGAVKLLDFGLAHLVASASPVPHLPTAGTPVYMAPEQWRGEPQDARTDVWAAGVMLFELLSGQLPYPGLVGEGLRARVTSQEPMPSVRGLCPELPLEVDALLASALAKQPERRMASGRELLEELRELAEHLGLRRAPAQPAAPERRQVTLVCCVPTGLPQSPDPEDLDELEAAFHQGCAEVIRRHGGRLALSMGIQVLACFGYPHASEGDSEQAARAALYLAEHFPQLLEQRLQRPPPPGLSVRVGLHTDVVALDAALEAGAPAPRGGVLAIRGEAPEVVAELARQAGPGKVLASGATYTLVRGAFDTEALGQRELAGLPATRSVQVYEVLRGRKVTSRFARTRTAAGLTPLVGRERELQELLGRWQQARQAQGATLLLCGEPGIGKSRLIHELRMHVGREGVLHLHAQCGAQFTSSALYPVIELLEGLLPKGSSPAELCRLKPWLSTLGLRVEQVQALAQLLALPPVEDLPMVQLTPERHKELVFEALSSLLLRWACERPVLAVVEDLHWADPSTLELLAFLTERVRQARVLLVLSSRPELSHALVRHPGLQRLELERLPAGASAVLARQAARGRPLAQEVLQQLVERTAGIPLFVEEVTHMVLEREAAGGVPASIPSSLRELLLAQLDALPVRQRAMVQLCAVVGRRFSRELLVALTRAPESMLARHLEGLVAAGMLQWEEEARPTYQFRHALIQDAACQSLPRSTRREYHHRIATVLSERFPEVAESRPELLAHHYTEAGEHLQAVSWWARAGLRASLGSANQEAIHHLEQALRLLRGLPDADKRQGEELQLLMTLGIPLVQVQGYRSPEVERTYERTRELLHQVGELLPRLELSYWSPFAYYVVRGELSRALELADTLVGLGERQHHRELLALGYRMKSYVAFTRGQVRPGLLYVERAVACAHFTLEEHRALARKYWVDPSVAAQSFGSAILSAAGQHARSRLWAQEALELAGRIGHTHTSALALFYSALGSHYRREAASTLELAERCQALSHEHRFRLWESWSALLRSWALAELGQPQLALHLMQQGLAHWRESGIRAGSKHHNLGLLAEVHLRLGQARQALETIDQTLESLEEERSYESVLHRLRGEALRMLGREQEARTSFLRALHIAREQGASTFERFAREALEAPALPPPAGQPSPL